MGNFGREGLMNEIDKCDKPQLTKVFVAPVYFFSRVFEIDFGSVVSHFSLFVAKAILKI